VPAGPIWDQWLRSEHTRRERAGLSRSLEGVGRRGRWLIDDEGRQLLNYASNDYLGLSVHPDVALGAMRALARGTGSTASRLMAGTDDSYLALENKLAWLHGADAALIFGSGYLANVGTISALVGRHDTVFSDQLNHASIVDGCLLSGADVRRFHHCDVNQLEAMLATARDSGGHRLLIVTESVFSMDGDVAPLRELVELRDRFGAALLVDESHAIGMFGKEGTGYSDELGVADSVDLRLGTFGKALGSYGAYVVAERNWIDHLLNSARTFIFSTALPPPVIGAVDAAIDVLRAAEAERQITKLLAAELRRSFVQMGLNVLGSTTQIVPIVIGSSQGALEMSHALLEEGMWVRAIRPPTVPKNSSRLRFSLTAQFTPDDVARTAEAVARCVARVRPALAS
jgi:8-amino-7-oxononanoate synthase